MKRIEFKDMKVGDWLYTKGHIGKSKYYFEVLKESSAGSIHVMVYREKGLSDPFRYIWLTKHTDYEFNRLNKKEIKKLITEILVAAL